MVLALDRLLRADPVGRTRAHLLWSLNPLLLWGLVAAGHVDAVAAAVAFLALALVSPWLAGGGVPARNPGMLPGLVAGVLVGKISLREIDWYARSAVLGVSFRPDRLGQGLGTDAMRIFLSYYFGPLGMEALFLDVAAHNVRARRCYERCGFRLLGEHWGEAAPDLAGVFRDPERAEVRPYFRWEHGLIRPLLYDMVIRRTEYERQAGTRGT